MKYLKKNSRIRGQSPRYTVGQCLKLEKTHSGIFCVGLWDNRSVGFAHENPPPLMFGERGVGRGGGFDPYAVYPQATPHPSLPPPDGGRDRVAVTEKGRLKNLFWGFSDDLFVFRHYKSIIASIR